MRSKLHAARVASTAAAGIVVTTPPQAAVTASHRSAGERRKTKVAGTAGSTAGTVSHEAAKRMIERAAMLQARDRSEEKEGGSSKGNALKARTAGMKDGMFSVKEGEGEGVGEESEGSEDEGEWEEVDDEEEIAALAEREDQIVPDSKDQIAAECVSSSNQAAEEKAFTSQTGVSSSNQGETQLDSQAANRVDSDGGRRAGSVEKEKAAAGREDADSDTEASRITECVTSESETNEGSAQHDKQDKHSEDDDGLGWDPSCCLFCEKGHDGSVSACVEHMHRQHGFFIPDAEYVADLAGLLQYLAGKIVLGRMCLFCDDRGRQFSSVEAVRGHMEAKSHAKLRYGDGSGEMEEELGEFYDFSSR